MGGRLACHPAHPPSTDHPTSLRTYLFSPPFALSTKPFPSNIPSSHLRQYVPPLAHQLERHPIGHHARVAVRDVCKRAAVHQRGGALQRLHRGRHQSVHQ